MLLTYDSSNMSIYYDDGCSDWIGWNEMGHVRTRKKRRRMWKRINEWIKKNNSTQMSVKEC